MTCTVAGNDGSDPATSVSVAGIAWLSGPVPTVNGMSRSGEPSTDTMSSIVSIWSGSAMSVSSATTICPGTGCCWLHALTSRAPAKENAANARATTRTRGPAIRIELPSAPFVVTVYLAIFVIEPVPAPASPFTLDVSQ